MGDQGKTRDHGKSAMSLLELLLVVAIIGTLATLVVPYVSPMQGAASRQIARQQQAELQTALGSWVAAASSGPGGLAAARSAYSGGGSKLDLLQGYLHPATLASLRGTGSGVTSDALDACGATLQFSSWGIGSSPSVIWSGGQ